MIQVPYVKTAMHNHSRLGSDVIVGRRFELPEALSFEEKFGPDDQFAAPHPPHYLHARGNLAYLHELHWNNKIRPVQSLQ